MSYKTLKKNSLIEIVEKRSRFIGRAFHVESEEEALKILAEIRTKHYDATHNVYAYIIKENNIARFSDDGEPSKTAGTPVLEVLTHEGLCDCMVVVTRYFGGTLLGTGGLVRAYSKSAKEAVDASGIANMEECVRFSARVNYTDWGKFQNTVSSSGAIIEESDFSDAVNVKLCITKEMSGKLISEITDKFSASIRLDMTEELYLDWEGA